MFRSYNLIQHRDILEQLDLMALQHGLDVLHIRLGLAVLGLEVVQLVALLLEETQNALLLFFVGVEVLQLPDEVGDHVAHLAQIFGGDLGEGGFGEVTDLFLAGGAVLQHLLTVGDVDLLCEGNHHRLLLRGQPDFRCGGGGGFLLLLHRRSSGSGVQRQSGYCGGIEVKIQGIVISHC